MQNKNFYQNEITRERKEKIKNLFQKKIEEKNSTLINHQVKERKKSSAKKEFIYTWKAKEFEKIARHPKWYLIFYSILFIICTYSLFTNNLLLSVLIILFGMVFYFIEKRDPKIYQFGIMKEGIFAQDAIYHFSSIENFCIFYYPNGLKELSLKNKKSFLSYIQIPLGETADPNFIKEILIHFIPEKKREQTFFEIIERFF